MGFHGLQRTFDDTFGVLTMYQVIRKAFKQSYCLLQTPLLPEPPPTFFLASYHINWVTLYYYLVHLTCITYLNSHQISSVVHNRSSESQIVAYQSENWWIFVHIHTYGNAKCVISQWILQLYVNNWFQIRANGHVQ